MHESISRGLLLLAAMGCLAVPRAGAAETPVAATDTAAAPATAPATSTATDTATATASGRSGFAQAPRQDEGRLAQLRGGSDPVWNDMKLNGTVGANAAQNVATGDNIIRDGAFANAAGLPTVIQNSGANVLIQNATIVNVQIR